MKKLTLIINIMLVFSSEFAIGNIIYVPDNYSSIQEGITAATDGDTVLVEKGIYNETITFMGKAIVVTSGFMISKNKNDIEETVIQALNPAKAVVSFVSDEDSSSMLCGFTIKGSNNSGIICKNSSPYLTNLIVADNTSSIGAGIRFIHSGSVVHNVTLRDNRAVYGGGGLSCSDSSHIYLNNLNIFNNSARAGGGIDCENSILDLSGVNIKTNIADIWGGGIIVISKSYLYFDDENLCNIYLNEAPFGCEVWASSANPLINVIVDTFTVPNPTEHYVQPLDNFKIECQNRIRILMNCDLFVSPSGNDNNTGQSQSEALFSISGALAKIYVDDFSRNKIFIQNGTYSPSASNERFPLGLFENVCISGTSKNDVILDGEDSSGVLYLDGSENVIVENVTITNGYTKKGGGIYCVSSNPVLKNVRIMNNTAEWSGGGIDFVNSKASLYNVELINNTGPDGGAIYCCTGSELWLENALIVSNRWSSTNGGAIGATTSEVFLLNCTICSNTSEFAGGGISISINSKLININSILWANTPSQIYNPSVWSDSCVVISANSIVQGGVSTVQICKPGKMFLLGGNLDTDPMFIDTTANNYQLQSNSPCIDKGIQDTFFVYNNSIDTIFIPQKEFYGTAPDIGFSESGPTKIITTPTNPQRFCLEQNYPNPFNPLTTIRYDIPKTSQVTLTIYNINGQVVERLINRQQEPGFYSISWDASNLSTGIYFYKIQAGDFQDVKKCLVVK